MSLVLLDPDGNEVVTIDEDDQPEWVEHEGHMYDYEDTDERGDHIYRRVVIT